MNYLSKDTRKKRNKVILILFLVIFLFFYSEVKSIFFKVFEFVVYPLWKTETYLDNSTFNPFGFLVSKKKLLITKEQLEKDIFEAEMMLSDRNALLKENLELKHILGRVDNRDFILASVLSRPNKSTYDSLIIDLGIDSGIKNGSNVFAFGDIFIGKIDEVDKKTSRVKLFSSPKEKQEVMIGFNNIVAIATGKGAGNFEVEVPREAIVNIGDPVVAVGTNSSFFGSVEEIISEPINPFKTVLFKSAINIFELKWIQVEK